MSHRIRLWSRRIAWMLVLWTVSVSLLGVVAYLLKGVMTMAGMTV